MPATRCRCPVLIHGACHYPRVAGVRDLIASGDLSHDEITAGWIETWAADLMAEERDAA